MEDKAIIRALENAGYQGKFYEMGKEYEVPATVAHAMGGSVEIISIQKHDLPSDTQIIEKMEKKVVNKPKKVIKLKKTMITGEESNVVSK